MYELFGWTKRIALAGALLAMFYVAADHVANRDKLSLSGMNNPLTFGAAPGRGAGAELCTYFNTPPPVFSSSQLGQVRCDANQLLMVTASLPYSYSASDGTQAGTAASGVGMLAWNQSTSTADRLQVNNSDNLLTFDTLGPGPSGGANVIGTTILQSWTPIIVSGNTTDAFGSTVCPSGVCGIQLKNGGGVISSLQFNSAAALGAITLTCWNSIGAGTIHTEMYFGTNLSSGEVWPIPSGGYAFSTGLWCQTSGFISATQNFAFGVR
jgi:hypothetical protein